MTAFEPSEGRVRARRSQVRRALAPLLAGVVAAIAVNALTGCGAASKPLGVTVTVAQTTPTAPASTAPAKAAPRAAPHSHRAAPASAGGSGTASGSGSTRTSPTAPPRAPASKDTRMIVACLTQSGLVKAGLRNAGLWGGTDPTTGEPVLVDGPYKTRAAADTSARSLNGVELAERGGAYVASATLKSHLSAAVHQVATCLDRAGAGGSGSGNSLSF